MPDDDTQTYGNIGDGPRRPDGTFKPGAGGRPKGSRNKLGEQFIADLQSLWAKDGAQVLAEARAEKPMEFAKMVASLLPKELLINTRPTDEMTDDELSDIIAALRGVVDRIDRADGSRPN